MTGELAPRGAWDEKQSFTSGQLAVLCRVHVKTTGEWARAGQLPFILTPGGHRRYWRAALSFLPPAGDPQLVSAADIAVTLSLCQETVWHWLTVGRLYRVCLPGGQLVRAWRSDVDALIATGRPVSRAE